MTSTRDDMEKTLATHVSDGYGTISIRVVVLQKAMAAAPALGTADAVPVDAAPDEVLPDSDKRPISTFLEEPKRGRQVCVFLINGQRQHAWDNTFIVRDLGMKYLRNRMVVVVDCDGLKPEAVADLMQGSRSQFYEGKVYAALESRVIATLKGDPDLGRLEEEAEDDISALQAGDEAVKAALDQLIESHHEAGEHASHGAVDAGESTRQTGSGGSLSQTSLVVMEGERSEGTAGADPVLQLRPDTATIRLKPNDERRVLLVPKPEGEWKNLETLTLTFDPPIKELQITRASRLTGEEINLLFVEAEEFEEDEYPIATLMRVTATFKGHVEPRVLERRVVITPKKITQPLPPTPKIPLTDDPTFVRVTSRQPIKIFIGGPDVHVKLRWDGKDELVAGNSPQWEFRVTCEAPTNEPRFYHTRPVAGLFELLIEGATALKPGEQLKFDVEAIGPGKTLSTAFLADVIEPSSARKITSKASGGGQRRPPYQLAYVKRENWNDANFTCFGQPWSGADAGSFDPPDAKTPLTIFINQDMDLLAAYRDRLLAKRHAEATIQQRINNYTAHVAFHLYQMYRRKKSAETGGPDIEFPSDEMLKEEIERVAHTLIKLMEVAH
jgi:hypothetical protein